MSDPKKTEEVSRKIQEISRSIQTHKSNVDRIEREKKDRISMNRLNANKMKLSG